MTDILIAALIYFSIGSILTGYACEQASRRGKELEGGEIWVSILAWPLIMLLAFGSFISRTFK